MPDSEFAVKKVPAINYLDFNGVRITPKRLILMNAYDGKEYKEKILFQNITSSPIQLRTSLPSYSPFKLKNRLADFKLYSGLSVCVRIEYSCANTLRNPIIESSIFVSVNNKTMDYYISVRVSEGYMYSKPRMIDFGQVNLEHLVTSKKVTIKNQGFKTSKYEIDVPSNDLGLVVMPNQGFIPAKSFKTIRIEFIGLEEGDFNKDIWVKCVTPFRIIVSAQVIRPKFVMDPRFKRTDNYYFVKFPPIYTNCVGYRSIQFTNKNTLSTCFVVVPEVKGAILSYKKAQEIDSTYNFFSVHPIDGYLDASEKKIIKFCFNPNICGLLRRETFFAFFRILCLNSMNVEIVQTDVTEDDFDKEESETKLNLEELRHSIFPFQKEDISQEIADVEEFKASVESIKNNQDDSNYIKICLCATVEPLKVEIYPEFIDVGEVEINTTVLFILNLTNKSNILPIYYRYRKTAFVDMMPPEGFLNRLQSTELYFKYTPKSCQSRKSYLTLELLNLNQINMDVSKNPDNFKIVGKIRVKFSSKINLPVSVPQAKFNPGITPMITNEVGFLTENVRFNDPMPKPRQAVVSNVKFKKNEENALIAFPNDRPATLRRTNQKNEVVKTIFAKIPRYVMEQDIYMLSEDREKFKKLIYKFYNDYILRKDPIKRYTHSEFETDYNPETICACDPNVSTSLESDTEKHIIRVGVYVLTPIQLFFVKVVPSVIDIGKVALYSKLTRKFKILNRNAFGIKVKLHTRPSNKAYLTNLPQEFHVNASSAKTIEIEFNGIRKGHIYTIITAMINEYHKLPIVFKANVTPFDLIIAEKDIVINMKSINMSKSVNLYNVFDVPVSYMWEVASGNSFQVIPKTGTVPPHSFLINQIYFELDLTNRKSSKFFIQIIDGLRYTLSATVFVEELNVEIFKKVIDLPHIPLNIEYISKAVLINNGYEPIQYSIRNPAPVAGIQLLPAEGILKRRNYQIITIKIHMKIICSFECTIDIDICNSVRPISFNIKGSVDFPRAIIKPEVMRLRKIQAGSFDLFPFYIENKGQSIIKLTYLGNMSPEFFITKTVDPSTEKSLTEFSLHPGEKENLILKYFPIDVTMLTFYLPFVINDILGPPIFNMPETLHPKMYLETFDREYSTVELNISTDSGSIPLMLVESVAVRHILKLSKTVLQFYYLPHQMYKNVNSLQISLKNVSPNDLDICIRLDDMLPNFNIQENPSSVQFNDNVSISFALEADESLIITFEYTPEKRGNHEVYLPIYIRDYNDCAVFNYITLLGEYPEVNITCDDEIKWEPVPLKEIIERVLEVKIEYHTENCKLNVTTDVPFVKFSFPDGPEVNSEDISVVVPVSLMFFSDKPFSFRSTLSISCDCGAKKTVKFIGCSDRSLLTTYLFQFEVFMTKKSAIYRKSRSISSIICKSSTMLLHAAGVAKFETTDSDWYLQKICGIVEEWLCQQVFYGKHYFKIPDHLCEVFYEKEGKKQEKTKSKKNQDKKNGNSSKPLLLMIKILCNILDDKILPELATKATYKTEVDRVTHYHMIYKNVLIFLEVQGAFLQGVQPKHMLNYYDYVMYENKIRIMKGKTPSKIILDEIQFKTIARNTWINILLQIFKVLVLPRVIKKSASSVSFSIKEPSEQAIKSSQYVVDHKVEPEGKLLSWATTCFNKNRETLMKLDSEKKSFLEERLVKHFEKDFNDGLVILGLLISYLPYLEEHLNNIFVDPDTIEKKFHNACKIEHVLKIINYSYNLKPIDIIQPFSIQIIMFLTYLHEVLPYFLPIGTIRYNVSLSKSKTENISLRNMEMKTVNYTVIILNNKLDCFTTDCGKTLEIQPNKSVQIDITYTAKLMSFVTSTLIFCGETVGGHYARTIVYTLEGEPNYEQEHDVVVYKLPLYTVSKKPLIVQSPYPGLATYSISIAHSRFLNNNPVVNPEGGSGSKLKFNVVYVEHPLVHCDQNGHGEVNLTVCSITPVLQEFWILFRAEDRGDFFIKVAISVLSLNDIEKRAIILMLPADFDNVQCTCVNHKIVHQTSCPRNILLKIPCKNDALWNTINEMILTTVDENEIDTWKNILYCDMGPDILGWFARENTTDASPIVQYVFERSVKYFISGSKFLNLQNVIQFDDVRHSGTVDIAVHLPKTFPKTFTITMKSINEMEFRIYEVQILYEKIKKTSAKSLGA